MRYRLSDGLLASRGERHEGTHLDDIAIRHVDLALANVVAGDVPRGNSAVCLKGVQHGGSVDVGTVVVGDGNIAVLFTGVDSKAAVGNAALQRPRIVGRVGAARLLVAVTARTVVDLTIWCSAIFGALSAPSAVC